VWRKQTCHAVAASSLVPLVGFGVVWCYVGVGVGAIACVFNVACRLAWLIVGLLFVQPLHPCR
jgi:hypothetical protein